MNVLVLNCGSSSAKFQVIRTDLDSIRKQSDQRLARGVLERVGSQSLITVQTEGGRKIKKATPLRNHREAVDWVLRWLVSSDAKLPGVSSLADIHAVGHRVVHGGERFRASTLIDKDVIEQIEDCIELAPLHNPANLKGIRAARELLGEGVPQAAVFDTSFHATMPETSYLYGIPYQLYRRYKIRRYGFHGTSHRYVAYRYRKLHKLEREKVDIISLHLGSGCSACAIQGGKSVNTTMGFTPLEGLLMGTRAGDMDPSIVDFLRHKEGMTVDQIETVLNKQSGLLGISGLTSDMRELLEEDAENQDRRARLAIGLFSQRVKRYIGAYLAELGGAQAVVFTGGIGENSPPVRERICEGLECVGLKLDEKRNAVLGPGETGEITAGGSTLRAFVIPTNEELMIARDTVRVVEGELAGKA